MEWLDQRNLMILQTLSHQIPFLASVLSTDLTAKANIDQVGFINLMRVLALISSVGTASIVRIITFYYNYHQGIYYYSRLFEGLK